MPFDNSVLKINEKDWLWKFYCKRFSLAEAPNPVVAPKNLCRYFWTSVLGLSFWLRKEAKVRYLWLAAAVSYGISASPVLNNEFVKSIPLVYNLLVGILLLIFVLSFFVAFILFVFRFRDNIENLIRDTLVEKALGILLLIAVGGFSVYGLIFHWREFFSHFVRDFASVLHWLPYILFSVAVAGVGAWVYFKVFRDSAFAKTLKTSFAYVVAVKHKMCPLVEPPDSFQEKEDIQEGEKGEPNGSL